MKKPTLKIRTKYRTIASNFKLKEGQLSRYIAAHEPLSTQNYIQLPWKKAENFSVWDNEGNRWIDLTSGIFVANAGHANPKIVQAIKKQLDAKLLFSYNYPTEIKARFIKKILSLSPKYFNALTLLNSGSEAMDITYKLIKLYGKKSGKRYIVTFKGNYHGRGLSNDLISGSTEKAAWSGVSDDSIEFIDFPYDKSATFDPTKLPPAREIAGFVVETFQGWGAWFYPKSFLGNLARFAKESGALLAFDEMQSGFYRIGPIYGYLTYGKDIQPDIIALGKGIASSLPLSAVLSRKELFDIDPKADLHGTQSGNPLCLAAGLANLEFLSSKVETDRRKKTIPLFEKEMKSFESSPLVTQVNVRGLIAGIIFKNAEDATVVVHVCIANGVLPVCTNRNSIKIAPPLTITAEAILEAAQVIRDALATRASEQDKS